MAAVLGVVAAAALPWFAAVDSLVGFAAVEGVVNVALLGMMVGVRTLVAHLFGGRTRVRYQAYQRSATNLGMAVGALVAVVPLQADTRDAYLAVFNANAVAAAVAAACVWFGPRVRRREPAGRAPRVGAFSDGPYLLITVLCGVLVARASMLTTAIPLWIGMDQDLPRGLAGVLLAVNTGLCVLLQVRLAGKADALTGARWSMFRGGYVFVPGPPGDRSRPRAPDGTRGGCACAGCGGLQHRRDADLRRVVDAELRAGRSRRPRAVPGRVLSGHRPRRGRRPAVGDRGRCRAWDVRVECGGAVLPRVQRGGRLPGPVGRQACAVLVRGTFGRLHSREHAMTDDTPGNRFRQPFPILGMSWSDFWNDPRLLGEDDGVPESGGWRYRRGATHLHRGIDLKGPIGSAVVAVEDGMAEFVSVTTGAGPAGWSTAGHRVRLFGASGAAYLYLHLGTDHAHVDDAFPPGRSPGDLVTVSAGEVIGYLGRTGGSVVSGRQIPLGAAHLHFEYHPHGLGNGDANPVRVLERTFGMSLPETGTGR